MTDTQPDKLAVTQEAREATADLLAELLGVWPGYSACHALREGHNDAGVQAFQRAMLQAATDEREACAKVAELSSMRSDIARRIRERTI